jgi:hypothetical protein
LRQRYPWISKEQCCTIPFGAAPADYEIAAGLNWENPYFQQGDGLWHGVYAGVLGKVMETTCEAICLAFKQGLQEAPDLFSRVRLHFVGTSYAGTSATATIRPMAERLALGAFIQEDTQRLPYFAVLRLLKAADFLLVPGSDNPQYTASKIYPYIMARKPLLALFHEKSSVIEVLQRTQGGEYVTFQSDSDAREIACALLRVWHHFLQRLPFPVNTDWNAFEKYSAREMTRQQCWLFDQVLGAAT